MVDPLNVNRRSTEIPFPFFGLFIYFYIYFFHKKRNSKARGGGGGGGGGCGRTPPPPGYGPAIEIIFVAEKLRVNLFTDLYLVTPVFSQALTSLFLFSEAEGV